MMLRDQEAAEDAVQEAALKSWQKLSKLRVGTDPRPWFLGFVAGGAAESRLGPGLPLRRHLRRSAAQSAKDWCRFSGTGTVYIEPGSPWQNPFVESFNGKARDELFAREIFDSVFEARVLYDDWCDVYNRLRPHSSLGYMPPAV